MLGDIVINLINSNGQLSNIFTKSPQGPRVDYICYKLDAHDLLAPTWQQVWIINWYLETNYSK